MDQVFFLERMHRAIMPSTGCTEPVAIALNTATARANAKGKVKRLTVTLDNYLYKNAMGVGIPGADERGVALCAAMGVTAGDAQAQMRVLDHVTDEALHAAKQMLFDGLVTVNTREDVHGLLVESVLETDEDTVRVLTLQNHTNIVRIDHAPFEPYMEAQGDEALASDPIRACKLKDMVEFADNVPVEKLRFLQDGIDMNMAIAQKGLTFGLGRAVRTLIDEGAIGDSPVARAEMLCAAASYARMSGVSMPVMTATGSGNQGITLLLTIEGVAQFLHIDEEKKLRAAALANLVNIYVKTFTGTLSAVCACGVASGLGASVGVVYMLGGGEEQMLFAMQNILGSICGMICDGAKEGCANKVQLSSGLAVKSAFLAMNGMNVRGGNGIVGGELFTLFENLGQLVHEGMEGTNSVIVRIMSKGSKTC
ncbi:MAG: L-serine ammonia-lyase, iron-sulfur-dependent, subunit alpha [Christensenellales bacterium]|nr:L-serine ammonia-lyase, iron-sulfur-dependent, subunit alpha [Christensenellales bacterium]